jgi:hypothetical protein
MKQTVTFLVNCANDRAGETKEIDLKRARRLALTGYVRIVETAMVAAPESAEADRPRARGPKVERRG